VYVELNTQRENDMSDNSKRLDLQATDDVSGRYTLDEQLLRDAFARIQESKFYGVRHLKAIGGDEIGMMDPIRLKFEQTCKKYGAGELELDDFLDLVEPGFGLTINSLQNPTTMKPNGFNVLAEHFLAQLEQAPGAKAQEMDMACFICKYDKGLGLHLDNVDTTMLVLQGSKEFVLAPSEDASTEQQRLYTLGKGEYLSWSSLMWHSNVNPTLKHSISLHFVLGPASQRHVPLGTPVEYRYEKTAYKDHLEYILSRTKR
jgi:hypothetical protein